MEFTEKIMKSWDFSPKTIKAKEPQEWVYREWIYSFLEKVVQGKNIQSQKMGGGGLWPWRRWVSPTGFAWRAWEAAELVHASQQSFM